MASASRVLSWRKQGFAVVMNGSREYLAEASRLMPHLVPVLVTVKPDILRARLSARGRESAQQIGERLLRAAAFEVVHPRLFTLENDGSLAEAGERLLARIETDLKSRER